LVRGYRASSQGWGNKPGGSRWTDTCSQRGYEAAVAAQLQLAGKHGADLRTGERVLGFEAVVDHVQVSTDQGTYLAAKLVLTTGPWVSEFLSEYRDLFRVFRQVVYWFNLKDPDTYELYHRMPIFIWEVDGSPGLGLYGFPAIDGPRGGLKLATEQYLASTSADQPQAPVDDAEIATMHPRQVTEFSMIISDEPGISTFSSVCVATLHEASCRAAMIAIFQPLGWHSGIRSR
jgi:sarcosine oxidase